MNIREYLALLESALDGLHAHPSLILELFDLLKNTGRERQFLKLFVKRLDFLQTHGHNAVQISENFERLDSRICSLHVDMKDKNIRVLYSINQDGTVLLLGFHERAGKSATDYSQKIPEATRRLRELEE